MPEQPNHYVILTDANGGRPLRFWLDPEAYKEGEFRGHEWDEQCPGCGESVNACVRFTLNMRAAICQECRKRFEIRSRDE
jgi:hypothetical protein